MSPRSDEALRSFFGARVGGQDRPQSVNTPQSLIDAILQLWPEGIDLDPCSNENSLVPARERICEPMECGDRSGLTVEWPDFTYANPPYGEFKLWLRKIRPGAEHLVLGPVRTNRRWFCEAAAAATRICFLRPFPFLGHVQAFPASLGMFYWGTRVEAFSAAFEPYGTIGKFITYTRPTSQELLHFDREGFYNPATGEVCDLLNKKTKNA